MPYQLINKNRFKEQQDKDNKQKLAIVITVSNKIKAKQLIANEFQFEKAIKKEKKYQDVGPGSIYIKCYRISHKRQSSYENIPEKCIMCAAAYPASKH